MYWTNEMNKKWGGCLSVYMSHIQKYLGIYTILILGHIGPV